MRADRGCEAGSRPRFVGVATACLLASSVMVGVGAGPTDAAEPGGLEVRYTTTGDPASAAGAPPRAGAAHRSPTPAMGLVEVNGSAGPESVRFNEVEGTSELIITSLPVDGGDPAPFTTVEGCSETSEVEVTCSLDPAYAPMLQVAMTPADAVVAAPDTVTLYLPELMWSVFLRAGPGADTVAGNIRGFTAIWTLGGDDEVYAIPHDLGQTGPSVRGGPGDDVLTAPEVRGGSGDDVVTGWGADDLLGGGPGSDQIEAGAGDDRVAGGAGRDLLVGNIGSDVMYGGRGADRVRAEDPDDDDVNCGTGRDEVWADWRDLTWRCELMH